MPHSFAASLVASFATLSLAACAAHMEPAGPDAAESSSEPAELAPAKTPPPAVRHIDTLQPGSIAGLSRASFALVANSQFCGGHQPVVTLGAPANDPALADVLAIRFPANLRFDPDDQAKRDASLATFDAWVKDMTARGGKARERYVDQLQRATDVRDQLAAAARTVQMNQYLATVLIHAEIPVDVTSGEFAADKREAFCDHLAEVAEPILDKAREAATTCATLSVGAPTGWWTGVCLADPKAATGATRALPPE